MALQWRDVISWIAMMVLECVKLCLLHRRERIQKPLFSTNSTGMHVCSSQKALSLLFRILTVFASVAEELEDGHDAHQQIIQCQL
jgi:hypothetical protein